MKKLNIVIIAMSALALAAVAGCGQKAAEPTQAATETVKETTAEEKAPAAETKTKEAESTGTEAAGQASAQPAADGTLTGPYLVTSCGQSPGAVMVNMVATQENLTSTNDNGLTADKFSAGDYKTLIVTTGTSMKGMGAAGTDVNAEIDRCVELIQAAKEAGLTIVGAHVEGMARRTDSSDAASIDAVMELADVILVIEDSDSDGFFTKYAEDNSKPLIKVKDALDIASVMK